MNGYKTDIWQAFLAFAFLVSFSFAVYFLCTSRTGVYDNGNTANEIRNELRDIAEAQRRETEVIDDATTAIANSERAITDSKQSIAISKRANKEIADVERADAEIIAECGRILSEVRSTAKTEAETP